MSRYNNTTYRDFILDDIRYKSLDQILEGCHSHSEKGHIYQAIWTIVVYFGLLPGFKRIVPIKSNLNKNVIIPLVNYDDDFLKRKGNRLDMSIFPLPKVMFSIYPLVKCFTILMGNHLLTTA